MGRRPIPENERTKPQDYPQMAFRVTEANKTRLLRLIGEIQANFNRKRKEDEPFKNKNDVILEALDIGLLQLQKSLKTRNRLL